MRAWRWPSVTTRPPATRTVVADITSAGGKAVAVAADSGDAEALGAAVSSTVAAYGGLDILVHNTGAGVSGPIEELTATTSPGWSG
ncbi:SDR family NAD(P)-dependent oxidoreductase [Streptomyces bullii]|uniref:SDR family NAD(P)-dependent oxidoreductase n=1 Tax=Streptomyces bullii TaxID=349910 RepID=A0ABW0V3J0_9ACTN